MTLADLMPNQRARIVAFEDTGPHMLRLAELGLIVGQEVSLQRRAPLGDPLHIALMRHELCLRAREARSVIVEVIS
jgi:ferrous iron transport protein A